jgi:hypothetical protein
MINQPQEIEGALEEEAVIVVAEEVQTEEVEVASEVVIVVDLEVGIEVDLEEQTEADIEEEIGVVEAAAVIAANQNTIQTQLKTVTSK